MWLFEPAAGLADARDKAATGAAAPAALATDLVYDLDYEATFLPEQDLVSVTLALRQSRNLLRRVRFEFDPARYRDFTGDGELAVEGNRVTWLPPAAGGALHYSLVLNHRRKGGGFDSLMEPDWAVFRGDDLLPPAAATARKGARARARLRLAGPEGWSFISAYPRSADDADWFLVDRSDRRFDRPVGWMAAGKLGVRWGTVAGRKVAVAGPLGQGVRHLDILAFLRWNLPELVRVFPDFPGRLLVVAAGDPMWRGGLSGPNSLYIHADRPLISGNGTSTLLHELVHVAQGFRAESDEDWIVEGIAEFYTLEILHRSGTISTARYERGFDKLDQWSADVETLQAESSSGARTAKAVAVMRQLDAELRRRSGGERSLDDVARQLAEDGAPVSVERLRAISSELAGAPLDAISPERLGSD
jgi:hypothetical protein